MEVRNRGLTHEEYIDGMDEIREFHMVSENESPLENPDTTGSQQSYVGGILYQTLVIAFQYSWWLHNDMYTIAVFGVHVIYGWFCSEYIKKEIPFRKKFV